MKKALGIIICLCVTSYFSAAYAHGTFTWFGFKNDNAEVMINSGTPHHGPMCGPHDCGHKKPKPKNTNIIKNRQNTITIINVSGGGAINFKT